jgi:hypothetical protein
VLLLLAAAPGRAAEPAGSPRLPAAPRPIPTFAHRSPTEPALAYSRAYHWLRGQGSVDADLLRQFNAVWESDRPLVDKTAATFALGDRCAAELFDAVRDPARPVSPGLPPQLHDRRLPGYYRANLALAYAKELCARRAFEDAWEALVAGGSAEVVDPALYFFLLARFAYELGARRDATRAVEELRDVADAPERYLALADRMEQDMEGWQDKDLRWLARKMENAARRLELGRADERTRKVQKEILIRLDEIIKERQWALGVSDPLEPVCPKR